MGRAKVVKGLCAVAFAALVACAFDALSGLAFAVDAGGVAPGTDEPPAAGGPPVAAATPDAGIGAPPPGAAPDATRGDRRSRFRRLRRTGVPGQPTPDAGLATPDAGVPDAAPFRIAIRDAGTRPMMPPAVIKPPTPPAPPPPPPQPTGPSTSLPITELGFNTCQKIPAGKRSVKMNLKPEVELPELVAWISSITCKSFVLPGHLSAGGKKLTFVTQGAMTPAEAYSAFLVALDSVGLTVERGPGYYKIIETSKAKTGGVPVYGFDGQPAQVPSKRTSP